MSAEKEEKEGIDIFELCTAILLGLAAIGAALSSLQGGQWGGKQLESFSQSNTMTTKATKEYNTAVAGMNADYAIVAQAKRLLVEAANVEDEAEQHQKFVLASYLYTQQLNWQAMKALGLPEELWSGDEKEDEANQAAQAKGEESKPAEPSNAAKEDEAAVDADLARVLPEDVLWGTMGVELHDEDSTYDDDMFSEADGMFKEADKLFAEGQQCNENGDKFDLVGVVYTVALFFAGLGVVFKSGVRWLFFSLGLIIFAGGTAYMSMLPWAS